MASDNSTAMDWIADIFFTKETDTPTKSLQKSIATTFSAEMVESVFAKPEPKQRRIAPPSRRVAKRKPKPKRAATTTIIAADPANFRQMVRQVTGARFGGFNGEAQGEIRRMRQGSALPTFDTSARSLDGSAVPPAAAAAGFEFDSFCCFPALESWELRSI